MSFASLNLCYVADASSIHVQRWLGYFVQQGHQVTCLSDKDGAIEGAEVIRLPNRDDLLASGQKANKTAVIKARAKAIQRVCATLQPNVVHAIFLYHRGWSAALADVHPLVITLLGSDIFLPDSHYRNTLHKLRDVALNQGALRQAELVTAVNATLQAEAKRLAGNALNTTLIPIGTNPELFHPQIDPQRIQAFRTQHCIPQDAFVFLSPRQVTPLYNIDAILDAFASVVKQQPHCVLIIKDSGTLTPEREAYRQRLTLQAQQLGIEHALRWVDTLPYEDLPVVYAASQAVISIPSTDGMPVTLFETMAVCVPVIVGDLSSYDEVVTHNKSGLRVPFGPDGKPNLPQLIHAMQRLVDEPALCQTFASAGQNVVKQYGLFDEQMARMETYYHQLATQPPKRSSQLQPMLYKMLIRLA